MDVIFFCFSLGRNDTDKTRFIVTKMYEAVIGTGVHFLRIK